ncbi:MAG: hypothetical protein ACKVPJ_05855 [Chitinophagales bacterium]
MKNLILTVCILLSLTSFAKTGSEQEAQLVTKIKNIVQVDKLIDALNLNGEAIVWVTIDENKTLQVERVEAGDFLKSFYVKKTLEGVQVDVEDSMIGKTYQVEVEFMQSKQTSSKF